MSLRTLCAGCVPPCIRLAMKATNSEATLSTPGTERFPRLSEKDEAKREVERKRLVDYAWHLFRARDRVRVELGYTFIRIKETFPHGDWQSFVRKTFEETHVSLRTVQRWMRLARKADQDSENDTTALFKPAMDLEAVAVRNATAAAEAEVNKRPTGSPSRDSDVYRLPLRMTGYERDRTNQLRKSPKWALAEEKVITLLGALYIEFLS